MLPAIDKIKRPPTDLFEIKTSSFSSSLNEKTSFVSKPEIVLNGREQIFRSGLKDIKEESLNDNRSDLHFSPNPKTQMLDMSIGKNSVVESEVDGLIKWANNLPDDLGGDNFFIKTLNSKNH